MRFMQGMVRVGVSWVKFGEGRSSWAFKGRWRMNSGKKYFLEKKSIGVQEERKKQEKRAAKQKLIEANKLAKQQRELRAKKLQEEKSKKKRVPFDFEKVRVLVIALGCGLTDINDQEKPKVLSSIVEASQASNNLQNAIQVDIFFERVSPIFTSS